MSAAKNSRSSALASLTAAALALPAFQAPSAARDEARSLSLHASRYAEDDIDADRRAGADGSRYDISVFQLRAATPLFERWRVTADVAYDSMSGASPWWVQPDASGRPIQVMSGATIDDKRLDVSLDWRLFLAESEVALVTGYSTEDDYEAANIGVDSVFALDGLTSINLGAGYSDDRVMPTDGGSAAFPGRIVEADRNSANLVAGITRILGQGTVIQSAVSAIRQDGFLADPYKQAFVDDALLPDSRPDERNQIAWTTRLRQRVAPLQASVHLDYRYYHDDWEIDSHTVDLAWYQEFGKRFWVVPSVRWYSQSQAYFYRPYYTAQRSDGLYSSDYRLSPYGAITLGLKLRLWVGAQALTLAVQHYDSSADYAIESVEVENPGLVDYTLGTVGFDFSF